ILIYSRLRKNKESITVFAVHLCKGITQIVERPRRYWNDGQPKCSCRKISLLDHAFLAWISGHEDGDTLGVRKCNVQKFKGLSSCVESLSGQSRDVATWLCERIYQPEADRIGTCRHHYRDRRRRPLERQRYNSRGTDNHIRRKRDKLTG